jgi:general secretion pathway protein G
MLSAPRQLRRTGFTLIELLTVVAVMAILASITIGAVVGGRRRAAIGRARAELAHLVQALEAYKAYYGDYPQTGLSAANSQRVTRAANGTSAGPGVATAQALLFNSLTGVYGPTGTRGGRQNGPNFVDFTHLTPEVALVQGTFGVASGTPPAKTAVNNAFVDPWDNRYMYYYKSPTTPGAASPWTAPAYVLFSCGPDGTFTASGAPTANGVIASTTQAADSDNLYADKLQ